MEVEVLLKTAGARLYRQESAKELELAYIDFPLPGYGNYVKRKIVLNKENNTAEVHTVHDGYSCGCGSLTAGHVNVSLKLPPEAFARIWAMAEGVRATEDFDKLRKELSDMQSDLEQRVSNEFDKVVEALSNMQLDADVLELLKDKDKVLKLLYDYVSGDC